MNVLAKVSVAAKVREVLPEMPDKFTIQDVRKRLPGYPPGALNGGLIMAYRSGMVKRLGKVSMKEWRAAGNMGGAAAIYTFISRAAARKAPPGRPRKAHGGVAVPNPFTLPAATADHSCDATAVLNNVQRSLATLNLLITIHKLKPEQITGLAGTIAALSKHHG